MAIRPKTLPAAISPVLVGTATAIHDDLFTFWPAFAAMIGSLLLQILSNLANDYYDFVKGNESDKRTGPTRVAASGLLSLEELKIGIVINIVSAIIIGLYLIYVGGIVILIIGILSIIFALLYSGGPYPLSTIGLGDIFVFIFFGLVAVTGSYYVQAISHISQITFISLNHVMIISVPTGLLITAILVINNYRDIEADKQVGKFTLAVFMGKKLSQIYFITLLIISYAIPFYLLFMNYSVFILLPLLSLGKAGKLIRNVLSGNEGVLMNKTLGKTAQLGLIYSILYAIGIVV